MAKKSAQARKRDGDRQSNTEGQSRPQPRPFWFGVIAFGLVNLPVSLFPAHRSQRVRLRMVDGEGTPLRRRYYCSSDKKLLERSEIVRGYPVEKDRYVLLEDEELKSLAPDKTREIDLRRFVPLESIDPVYFERGYFLAPDSESTKAYRLLARVLEKEQRAGVATFVMRDREYIVAIVAEEGILRAQTLRFHDEIRTPAQIGLSEPPAAKADRTQRFSKAMKSLSRRSLDPTGLVGHQDQRLRELLEKKLEAGTDVIEAPDVDEEDDDTNVIDLMQVLKERLQGKNMPDGSGDGDKPSDASSPDLASLTRDELYALSRQQNIKGRSKMNKDDLIQALEKADSG